MNSQNDRTYFKGQKEYISDKNLSYQMNRQSGKIKMSATLTVRSNKTKRT